MPGRTAASILLLVCLGLGSLAAGGCGSLTDPFLGVPEWQTVGYGDDAPDPALDGVPRITAVEDREYAHYVRSSSSGRIVAREERGGWIYYALATRRVVGPKQGGPSGHRRAVAVVYERYRAKMPPRLVPKPPPHLPDHEPQPSEDAVIVPAGPKAEEIRNRIEEDLRRRREERGGPKIIRPESSDGGK